ncbi:MAG TPA: KGG domain-containing protein [Pseudomonadales bacterium]
MARQETRSGTSNRGFASMDPELQRAIASKGGKAAHQSGNAHRFTSEEAREAGRKGGQAAHRRSAASQNRTARDEVDFEKEAKAQSDDAESDDMEEEHEGYKGNDQSLQTSAKDTDHSRQGGYPQAHNEARGHGRSHGLTDNQAAMRDYQAENQGRNQGRNNFSTDQERAARSGQGRDR